MSTNNRIFVFANPIAGAGRGNEIAHQISAQLGRVGYGVRSFFSRACDVPADELHEQPASAAIVIGGDGTLLAVAQRLLAEFDDTQLPPLLTVPLGTANLMAKHLRCNWNLNRIGEEVAAALRMPREQRVDVADASGRSFLLVAGAGFDAGVVHALAASRRGPIGYAHYLLPTLDTIKRYRFHPLSVEADGVKLLESVPAIAFVGNVPEYGAGFSVTPLAKSDDGLLDLCILPCRDWRDLMEIGMICGAQLQASHERSIYRRVKRVSVSSDAPVPLELDGEAAGFTPTTISITGRQLRFLQCGM